MIIGTRPEAVKMIPVYLALKKKKGIATRLISTGQHKELLRQTLNSFGIKEDINLNVMESRQTLSSLTAKLLTQLELNFQKEKPDYILAHGDTTTCYVTALSSFYHNIPFFHVESGLRTHNLNSPFPEEFNRQAVAQIANHHFAPTQQNMNNLINEGISPKYISVIGNTIHDAMSIMKNKSEKLEPKLQEKINLFQKSVVLTLHRREGITSTLNTTMQSIRNAATVSPETIFICPVHPNPHVKNMAESILSNQRNIALIDPQPYPIFLSLLHKSSLVLTDSGGVQEEAAYFGKPTLILRKHSERTDGFAEKNTELIDTSNPDEITKKIISELTKRPQTLEAKRRSDISASKMIANFFEEKCLT